MAAVGATLLIPPVRAQEASRLGTAAGAAGTPQRFTTHPAAPPNATTPTGLGPKTLSEALAASYANNPQLQAARAQLRSVDENVPQALAGWRPTVVVAGTAGYGDGYYRQFGTTVDPTTGQRIGGYNNSRQDRDVATAQATVTQPLYRGGRTRATTNRAENQVRAQRARLIAQEQSTFTDTINAYVGVIEAQEVLALDVNNTRVLAKQLQATNDRFRVGEITRTDVAQAEAALAGATATQQTAEGNLATSRATYQRVIGYLPPGNLVEPQPLRLPAKTEAEAVTLASSNNPNVVAAQFDDSSAKDAVDVAFSALMPNLSLQGQTFQQNNSAVARTRINGYEVLAQLSVPLYQGGAEYSAVRQARQQEQQARKTLDDARRAATQQAIQAWETLDAARATVESTRSAIRANQIALEGVEREAIVGSRTTQDVLNQQQQLLNSEVTLVQNLANLVTASYTVAAAVGRLTARDLNLPVPLYDETAYYNDVRDRWTGTGDYATGQPGR
ncbi:MAG: TolC family outer membrane protein [Acetobacteraceae bacterium]|nr:TolC family outer membrane protein [Acetobacteraceae bacterium]